MTAELEGGYREHEGELEREVEKDRRHAAALSRFLATRTFATTTPVLGLKTSRDRSFCDIKICEAASCRGELSLCVAKAMGVMGVRRVCVCRQKHRK